MKISFSEEQLNNMSALTEEKNSLQKTMENTELIKKLIIAAENGRCKITHKGGKKHGE